MFLDELVKALNEIGENWNWKDYLILCIGIILLILILI